MVEHFGERATAQPTAELGIPHDAEAIASTGQGDVDPLPGLQKARPPLKGGSRKRKDGEVSFGALEGIDGVAGPLTVLPARPLLFKKFVVVSRLGGVAGEDGNCPLSPHFPASGASLEGVGIK